MQKTSFTNNNPSLFLFCYILFCFLLGLVGMLKISEAIGAIQQHFSSEDIGSLPSLVFLLGSQICILLLFISATLICVRYGKAVQFARLVLLGVASFIFVVSCCFFVTYFPDLVYTVAFFLNTTVLMSLLCFLYKKYLVGTIIAVTGVVALYFATNSLGAAVLIFYETYAYVPIVVFPFLYYFWHINSKNYR